MKFSIILQLLLGEYKPIRNLGLKTFQACEYSCSSIGGKLPGNYDERLKINGSDAFYQEVISRVNMTKTLFSLEFDIYVDAGKEEKSYLVSSYNCSL